MPHARLAVRAPFRGQVDVVPPGGDGALREHAQDVSETGMFVCTRRPFRVGDHVALRFDHGGDAIHIRTAEVIWVRRQDTADLAPGIGVRFVSVDPLARAALRRVVSPHRSRPPSSSNAPTPRRPEPTDDLLVPAPAGPPLPGGFGASMVPTRPLLSAPVTLPPDDDLLSSEARVFTRIPVAPRPVTLGPSRLAPSLCPHTLPARPLPSMMPSPSLSMSQALPQNTVTPAVVWTTSTKDMPLDSPSLSGGGEDLFSGWTFRRALPFEPEAPHDTPADLHLTFDDDAPGRPVPGPRRRRHRETTTSSAPPMGAALLKQSLCDDQNDGAADDVEVENAFFQPNVSFSEPPQRRVTSSRTKKAPARLSLQAAAAFLVAGCCAGAVVGLLEPHASTVVPQASSDDRADDGVDDNGPTEGVALASPDPTAPDPTAPDPTAPEAVAPVAVVEQALPPPALADAAEAQDSTHESAQESARKAAQESAQEAAQEAAAHQARPTTSAAPRGMPATEEPATTSRGREGARATASLVASATATKTNQAHTNTKKPSDTQVNTAKAKGAGRLEVNLPKGGRVQKAFALSSPARVVVDVKGTSLPVRLPDVAGAREVRVGRPQKGVERVVIVLEGDRKPELAGAKIAGDRLVVRWKR
jgi:uncharacterized protein (TIGR02266 family)